MRLKPTGIGACPVPVPEYSRYTTAELAGGELNLLAAGSKPDMLELERYLHENFPLGPEEGQSQYIQKQIDSIIQNLQNRP